MKCQDIGGIEKDGYCIVTLSNFKPPLEGEISLSIPLDYLENLEETDVLEETSKAISEASENVIHWLLDAARQSMGVENGD